MTMDACFSGQTKTSLSFRGLNWALSIGDGNRHRMRQSPVNICQMAMVLSRDAETSL